MNPVAQVSPSHWVNVIDAAIFTSAGKREIGPAGEAVLEDPHGLSTYAGQVAPERRLFALQEAVPAAWKLVVPLDSLGVDATPIVLAIVKAQKDTGLVSEGPLSEPVQQGLALDHLKNLAGALSMIGVEEYRAAAEFLWKTWSPKPVSSDDARLLSDYNSLIQWRRRVDLVVDGGMNFIPIGTGIMVGSLCLLGGGLGLVGHIQEGSYDFLGDLMYFGLGVFVFKTLGSWDFLKHLFQRRFPTKVA